MKFLPGVTACVCALFLCPLAGCATETSDGTGGTAGNRGPDGLCNGAADTAVFESLEYTNDDGDLSVGPDAANEIAGDCLFGPPPRCGTELLDVIAENSEEHNAALAACEVACLMGQAELSSDCLGCFAEIVVCSSANCVSECAGGAFLPDCESCRIENGCDADFDECTGEISDGPTLVVTVSAAPSLEELFGGEPIEGAELCETDTDNCASSDAEGHAAISVTAGEEISYTVSKEGYLPYLVPTVLSGSASTIWPMLSEELLIEFGQLLMVPYPWTGGSVALAAFPLMPGVTFELIGETVPGYYTDEDGTPVPTPSLTETSSSGRGGFVEVPAGEYEVELGGAAMGCARGFGWPATAAERVRIPVRVGHVTYATLNNCSSP